jgi:alpha-L-arabinofuranosidase
LVTVNYESGPHDGFVEFYAAMKRMNPRIHVCEAEEGNTKFLRVMGRTYPYDCVEFHSYAAPRDTRAPITLYEEDLMASPQLQGKHLTELQDALRHYTGRAVPVVLTEYGQLVSPMPASDPDFDLSLDEGLLVASELSQWIVHGIPLAEKYLLNSTPFLGAYRLSSAIDVLGLSVNNAMIAGLGPPFIVEPTGEVMRLMSQLAGAQRLWSWVVHDPVMTPRDHVRVPVLECLAAVDRRTLDILVVNTSPLTPVGAELDLGAGEHSRALLATVVDGPDALAYNTIFQPDEVNVSSRFAVVPPKGTFEWTFRAHSVTLLQLELVGPAHRGS